MSRLLSERITLHKRLETVGADGRTTATTSTHELYGAFRKRLTTDSFEAGVIAVDELEVYLAPTAIVPNIDDVLTIRGADYSVVSDVLPAVNFRTGIVHHNVVRCRKGTR